ncbi:MAG: hypothetical protein UU78_C0100G0007, partial [Candidatus Roizmanbacteria bacterium GW2011_GWC2_41_7]
GKGTVTITSPATQGESTTQISQTSPDGKTIYSSGQIPTSFFGIKAEVPQQPPQSPLVSTTPSITSNVGLTLADIDTATSAEHGETGAVDDTSDITLGVQGVVGSAYSAVGEMVANESATAAGMTSSAEGRPSAEAAAQNASNSALAGGRGISNSTSVTTATGIVGTVGIMGFGAGQQSALTVTLSNGVTASFGMNAGTLASQGLTNSEGQQAIALALQSTQQALQSQSQPKGSDEGGTTGQTGLTSADVDVAVTAEKFGTNYNLPSNSKFTVSDNSSIAAKNDNAFSGGTTRPTGPGSAGPTGDNSSDGVDGGGPSGDAGDGGPGGPSGDGGNY